VFPAEEQFKRCVASEPGYYPEGSTAIFTMVVIVKIIEGWYTNICLILRVAWNSILVVQPQSLPPGIAQGIRCIMVPEGLHD
jgi:hypothetical protein